MRVGMTNPQADAALVASLLFQVGETEFAAGFQTVSYQDQSPTLALGLDMLRQCFEMAGIVHHVSAPVAPESWQAMRIALQLGCPALLMLPNNQGGGDHRWAVAHAHPHGVLRMHLWVDHNRALACQPLPEPWDCDALIVLAELVTLDMDEVPVLSGD